MKELIIAIPVIIAVLIIWDLTKKILHAKDKKDQIPVIIGDPGKERIQRYAQSFSNLANTFYNMPYRKERLSPQDLEGIFEGVSEKLCSHCERCNICWKKNYQETYRVAYEILNCIDESGEDISLEVQEDFSLRCIHSRDFLEEMIQIFHRARLNLMWNNRLLENRIAVSEQLGEMANIMESVADNLYDVREADSCLESEIKKTLRFHAVMVKNICVLEKKNKKQEIFITMCTKKGRCIPTKEIGTIISKACEQSMVPARDSRNVLNSDYSTVLFVEDTHFRVLNGVARLTKEGETVSGDNFAFTIKENGQVIMSLSDGMGSGLNACKDSEMVIELLEEFLEAGFKKETAVKMINSAMVIQTEEKSFSTIDICSIDLYSGVSEFLKIGASSTFIKRDHWVEVITSTTLPAGILQQVDYDSISKKLYDGDFIIMVSDGVLDALPANRQEEILKEIIMQVNTTNAKELARNLLERIMVYNHCSIPDDMTVLVAGVWKK